MNKSQTVASFISGERSVCKFGSLKCSGEQIMTYGVVLAIIVEGILHINTQSYSATSSRHLGIVRVAASLCSVEVREHATESELKTALDS